MKRIWNFKTVWTILFSSVIFAMLMGCTSIPDTDDPDFLGDYPPQHLGTLHLNIVKRYTNELVPRNVSFVFEPRLNMVRFHHKFMGDNIWIHLTKENRAMLKKAIETYLADFQTQRLTPAGSKKKGSFGRSSTIMTWGLFGSAHTAWPALRFEYQFITPQRPYFILATQSESSEDGHSSPAIRIAVSPAQCKELLTALNDDMLFDLINTLRREHEKFDVGEEDNPIGDIEKFSEETDTPERGMPAASEKPAKPDQPFDEF